MSKTNQITFFFFLLLVLPIVYSISISENVQFSFANCPSGLPANCSGNYIFDVNHLRFFHIELFSNYSRWNNTEICRSLPFYQRVNDNPDIFNWECCISEWVTDYTECNIQDEHTLVYIDTRSCYFPTNIPIDNGTISYCNYCSEDLESFFGYCEDNSTQSVDWIDNNQSSCCDVTGLSSDCSILTYPYNETTSQFCKSTNANIGTPNCRDNPELSDLGDASKEDCVVKIPDEYMNESYKCFSIVTEKDTGEIVQTNPDTKKVLPVSETREYFEPLYNNINFYYTSENLQPEKDYVVRVECASPERVIYSEYDITRNYENLSWVFFRIEWLTANAGYIVGGIILISLILLILSLIMRSLK